MRILFLAAEVSPFVKVGGLADVIGALPCALAALGHDVRVAMPRYGSISPERYGLKTVIPNIDVPIGNGTTGVAILEGALAGEPHVPIYFVQNQHYFERFGIYGYSDDADRFVVFNQAALIMLPMLGWQPDIIHANDWHTALAPTYLRTSYHFNPFYNLIRSAFTIHNLAYQGWQDAEWLTQARLEHFGIVFGDQWGKVNLMGRAIAFADAVSTVSPTYAAEIMTPEYGEKLDWLLNFRWGHLWGILNGIDYMLFNPATDPQIAIHYDSDNIEKRAGNKSDLQRILGLPASDSPLVGMVSRLADQKGFDLIAQAADQMLARNIQLVVLGQGERYYEDFLRNLQARYPYNVRVVTGFDLALAQKIYAGSDIFLMPSRFEPGGLGQLIALRYGAVPLVRHTGGLADTVQEFNPATGEGNGFKFEPYEAVHLLGALDRALAIYRRPDLWRSLIKTGMNIDHSWQKVARQYLDFYKQELGLS